MKITANTYVSIYGHTVTDFLLTEVETASLPAPEDFTFENAFRHFQGKTTTAGVLEVKRENDAVRLVVDPFLYGGWTGFSVTCSNSAFSFTREDVAQVNTAVADEFISGFENGIRYRMHVPACEGPRPLVLFLHGGGEGGKDNMKQLVGTYGPTAWAERYPEAYILAPQAPMDGFYIPLRPYEPVEGDEFGGLAFRNAYDFKFPADYSEIGWGRTLLANICAMIRRMIRENKVDPKRVYVTGMSMGGAGTIRAINVDRDLFAAAVPVCPYMSDEIAYELAHAGKNIKIRATNAYVDNLFDRSKYLIDGIISLMDKGNENAFLTMFSKAEIDRYGFGTEPGTTLAERLGLNHNAAWTLTFSNEHGIMDWLMSQVKE